MLQPRTVSQSEANPRNSSPVRVVNAAQRREPTPEEIRQRAFQIYERRGREPGHEVEDWVQAERELRGRN